MAIDRVGKPGGLPQTPDTSGAGGAGGVEKKGTGEAFHVERSSAANPAERAGAAQAAAGAEGAAATPLARLRAGEIDVHGYIDLKVDEATKGLHGLSTSELDGIKSILRDQMATDPGLADLVRTATGQMPKPPED